MATLPTDIDDFTTVIDDNYPATGDAVGPNLDDLLRLTGASIADLRDITREAYVTVEDKRFGGAGDDATNNITPLTDAMAAGSVVQFGAGTYRFEFSGANGVPITTPTTIRGQGRDKTILKFVMTSASPSKRMFNITGGPLVLEGVTVEITNADNAIVTFFGGDDLTGLTLRDCTFNGGVTDDAVSPAFTCYGVFFPGTASDTKASVTNEDIEIRNCIAYNFTWFITKDNDSESTQKRIRVLDSEFYDHYRTPILLNSPNGVIEDVVVDRCTIRDNVGLALGEANCFHVAIMGTGIRLTNSKLSGAAEYAIHCEELPDKCLIDGNVIDVPTGSTGGIRLVNNDNSGTLTGPTRTIISNNIISYGGTAKTSGTRGILINTDGDVTTADATKVDIHDNRAEGFEYGYTINARLQDNIRVYNNVAHTCSIGFRHVGAPATCRGNTTSTSDYAVGTSSGSSGFFVDHVNVACTDIATDGGRTIVLTNPSFEFAEFTTAGGPSTDYKNIIPLGSNYRVTGTVSASIVTSTSGDTDFTSDTVLWDGTTATITNVLSRSGGGITMTIVSNAGYLAVKVESTSARTNCRLVVQFNGTILAAA